MHFIYMGNFDNTPVFITTVLTISTVTFALMTL